MSEKNSPTLHYSSTEQTLTCSGAWILSKEKNIHDVVNHVIHTIPSFTQKEITLDGQQLSELDSVGAWWLRTLFHSLDTHHIHYQLKNFSSQRNELLTLFSEKLEEYKKIPTPTPWPWLARLGKTTAEGIKEIFSYITFVGEASYTFLFLLRHPRYIQWRMLANVIQTTGYNALPITGLLAFLVGIVLAYQMGQQLRNYGANIFVVDLMAVSVLREFGPMMTAIIIAGRSGSAFTAQIGSMKVNQEIDALKTLGIRPVERLVLPKLLGLLIALPLLTVWADLLGIIGGMIMAKVTLDVNFEYFVQRFDEVVPLRWYLIGLIKTPIFALLISTIGCFQGLRVEHNADSVGTHTTKSVVQAIFMIITFDALYSVLLSWLKI